jgi:large subunit ribosomal protein L32e
VFNLKDLERIDSKNEAVKIGSSVGKRKRGEILKKAEEKKIKVLNH